MGNSHSTKITKEQVESIYGTPDEHMNCVVNDVLDIVNNGKQYKRRPITGQRNIENKSTLIAQNNFGAHPYKQVTKKEVLAVIDVPNNSYSTHDLINDIADNVLDIVNNNKTYKYSNYSNVTTSEKFVKDHSIKIAKDHFGVDAYQRTYS
jgi:hypothetical protein